MVVPIGPSDIGTAGEVGFGVGVSLPALPAGYTYLGTTDRSAPNFGRYLNASAQPERWVPACWLRVGSTESPRYAEFGVDAVDVLPLRAYYNLPDADADGYFLHPALDVDGHVQSGFFRGAGLTADQLDYVETLYTAALQVNPLILFSNGEQGAWYDPSDLSTLFQDAAGSTPVTAAGQPVGLMLDKSGRGNHARQATAPARPLYHIDAGRPYLAFDGVDDFMVTTAFAWGSGQLYAGLGLRKNIGTPTGMFCEFSDSSEIIGGFAIFHSGTTSPKGFSGFVVGSNTSTDPRPEFNVGYPPPIKAVVSLEGQISTDTALIRADGVQRGSDGRAQGIGNYGGVTPRPLYLGSRGGTSLFLNGRIYGAIFRNVPTMGGNLTGAEAWLASKAGVTLP